MGTFLLAYVLALAAIASVLVVRMNPFIAATLLMVAVPALAVSGLGLVGWAALRRSPAHWRLLRLAGWTTLAAIVAVPVVDRAGSYAWFRWHDEPRLDALVAALAAEPRLRSFGAGTRYYTDLNGRLVRHPDQDDAPPDAMPLDRGLALEGISRERYDRVRARLLESGYLSVAPQDGFLVIVKDGMLDNVHGVIHVPPGVSPPAIGTGIAGEGRLVGLRHLRGRWYAFATT